MKNQLVHKYLFDKDILQVFALHNLSLVFLFQLGIVLY